MIFLIVILLAMIPLFIGLIMLECQIFNGEKRLRDLHMAMESDNQTLDFLFNDQAKYLAMRKKFEVEEKLTSKKNDF